MTPVETSLSTDGTSDEVEQMQIVRCFDTGPRVVVGQLAFLVFPSSRLNQLVALQDPVDGGPAKRRDTCALQLEGQRICTDVCIAQFRVFAGHDDLSQTNYCSFDFFWCTVVNVPRGARSAGECLSSSFPISGKGVVEPSTTAIQLTTNSCRLVAADVQINGSFPQPPF